MDESIPNSLKTTFLVHLVIGAILGLAILLVPGRTLVFLGWLPETVRVPQTTIAAPGTSLVDPVVTRVLGAALLALAFSSFQGWRAQKWSEVALVVQLEAAFSILGVIAFLGGWYKMNRPMPLIGWVLMLLLAAFGVAWVLALRPRQKSS